MKIEDYSTADREAAHAILQPYRNLLDYTAPEQTIHELREQFLEADSERTVQTFTAGMRVLLEMRYLNRLNDERLELSPAGREWLLEE